MNSLQVNSLQGLKTIVLGGLCINFIWLPLPRKFPLVVCSQKYIYFSVLALCGWMSWFCTVMRMSPHCWQWHLSLFYYFMGTVGLVVVATHWTYTCCCPLLGSFWKHFPGCPSWGWESCNDWLLACQAINPWPLGWIGLPWVQVKILERLGYHGEVQHFVPHFVAGLGYDSHFIDVATMLTLLGTWLHNECMKWVHILILTPPWTFFHKMCAFFSMTNTKLLKNMKRNFRMCVLLSYDSMQPKDNI